MDEHTPSQRFRKDVTTHLKRNYSAHGIEGGIYVGGIAFLSLEVVFPAMLEDLNAPVWLISFLPIVFLGGVFLAPLFTAHLIEKLTEVKPVIMISGIFQRLPFLLGALALFYLYDTHPVLTLAIVASVPFLSGLSCGITLPAWFELLSNTIPDNRRSSMFALRETIAVLVGLFAGWIVTKVLTEYPGHIGYGILHLCTFAFVVVSYVIFSKIREVVPPQIERPHIKLRQNLKNMCSLFTADTQLRNIMLTRFFTQFLWVILPFFSIHALTATGKDQAFAGSLVIAIMLGGFLGNIIAGYLGDKIGGKISSILARFLWISISVGAIFATSVYAFLAIFFIFGIASNLNKVGMNTLNLEICPRDKRPTYMAASMFILVPGMLVAGALCWLINTYADQLFTNTDSFSISAVVTAIAMTIAVIFLLRVKEPRKAT